VFGVLIRLLAAWAEVGYSFLPSREIAIAAVEIGDVSCDPILESLRELIHHLAHASPIDVIKSPWEYLVSFAEELLSFGSAPVLVDA
jgi:hypothetical protein